MVIYGRRVGKTAIITQFIRDKKAIFFMGVESSARQNLENLSQSILEFSMDAPTETAFLSFQAALEHVFRLAKEKRLILAIDEYPYGIATGASYFVIKKQDSFYLQKTIHQGLHRFGEKIRKRGTGNLS